jgi:hypothetical protein
VPNAALIPPAASTVWASSRRRLPITTTSLPAWYAAIAARSPAAPVPITKTLATLLRSDKAGMLHGPCRRLRQAADPPKHLAFSACTRHRRARDPGLRDGQVGRGQ